MKTIYTSKGEPILVDDEDYDRLNQYTWWLDKDGYAVRSRPHPIKGRPATKSRMHREVMGLEFGDPREVDHRFGARADNRKSELRVCARGQNKLNRPGSPKSAAGLKGVKWKARDKRWEAYIQLNRKRTYLGSFTTPEEAHEAYCKAAAVIHGEFANTTSGPDSTLAGLKAKAEMAVLAPLVQKLIKG